MRADEDALDALGDSKTCGVACPAAIYVRHVRLVLRRPSARLTEEGRRGEPGGIGSSRVWKWQGDVESAEIREVQKVDGSCIYVC